jgi:immune inhibitor A
VHNRVWPILLALVALAVACQSSATPTPTATPALTPTPTPTLAPGTTPTPLAVPRPPESDWLSLVARYQGVSATPLTDDTLFPNDRLGDERDFWVLDLDGPRMTRVPATLALVRDTALWYVADNVRVDQDDLATAAASFDDDISPAILATFAPNRALPGKITILNADIPGLGGYFSSADSLPQAAFAFSNQRMMMVMNGTTDVAGRSYQGTLAHEYHHLVTWLADPTEETWISEGTAELAARSLGLPSIPYESFFRLPDVSLANWPEDTARSLSAYAGASLFALYLAERTRLENFHRFSSQPLDGAAGVDAYLRDLGTTTTFPQLFTDWFVANLVGADDGPYAYPGSPGAVSVSETLRASSTRSASVGQLAGAYVRIDTSDGPVSVAFAGDERTPALPVTAHSGDSCWWSNRGNNIDSTLTRALDLRNVDSATLRFWHWYAIEDGFDRGYVAASRDDGASWQLLEGQRTSTDNPVGTSLGASFTGQSARWGQETIDLGAFAGSNALLRFEYVTDEAVNTAGWCIDDISIDEIEFTDDAERDGDWTSAGFVRMDNAGMPQHFALRLVIGDGNSAQVIDIPLETHNEATFEVTDDAVLVVAALTAETTQPGQFTLTSTTR